MGVAEELETQKNELKELIARTPGPQRSELRDQLSDVLDKIDIYVDREVDKASDQYGEALAELQAANAAIKLAQNDLSKTAEITGKSAKAMGFLQKLIEAAA